MTIRHCDKCPFYNDKCILGYKTFQVNAVIPNEDMTFALHKITTSKNCELVKVVLRKVQHITPNIKVESYEPR